MTLEQAFIARLQEMDPQPFAMIGGAVDFASIDNGTFAMPAAFVLVEEEASAPTERMTGPVLQRCEADVAVVIVTENFTDATGEAAAGELGPLKAAVRGRLIGFVPEGTDEPVQHVEGKLLKARNGKAWQRELFAAGFYLEEQE